MISSFSFFIARRFSQVRQQNRNILISFVSVSSLIGIAIGVMIILIGLSAMNGFEHELQNRVLSVIPHAELNSYSGKLNNWQPIQEEVAKNSKVSSVSPYVSYQVLAENSSKLKGVGVLGVDIHADSVKQHYAPYIDPKEWEGFVENENQIILGNGLAQQLNVVQGDWLTILIPDINEQMKLKAPERIRVQVQGVINLAGQLDHHLALIPLTDAQRYFNMGASVSGLSLTFTDVLDAPRISAEMNSTLSASIYIESWTKKYGYMYRDIQMVRTILYLVMVLVISVACFNIVSTLIMTVKDRASDIAILRTMGAPKKTIRNIFIWHGLLAGVWGSIIGSLMGSLLSFYLSDIMRGVEHLIGHKFLSGEIYFIDFLPSQFQLSDAAIVCTTAIILSLIATLYPATRATKIEPAKVLSGR